MKVAFLANSTPRKVASWSGVPYYALRELRRRFPDIQVIDTELLDRAILKLRRLANPAGLDILREPIIAKLYARVIERRLERINPDIVVSLGASHKCAYIGAKWRLVHVSDATFAAMVNYYPRNFSGLSPRALRNGNDLEQRMLDRCVVVILASEWAAESAVKDYRVPPERLRVVPLGANFDHIPAPRAHPPWGEPMKLLFVGVDWVRKGGRIVLPVFQALRERLPDTELHIVGCRPAETEEIPGIVHHGFLRKAVPAELEALVNLYQDASFLFVPSHQEAFGLVFVEASAFGLPAIVCRTGGVPTIVKDGESGLVFDLDAPAEQFVERILGLWGSREAYMAMRARGRERYESRLNWQAWGSDLEDALRRLVL